MCTILDNDVVAAVFRPDPCPGAREFKRWIEAGGARLVVGGKNLRELCENRAFRAWLQEALRQSKATSVPDSRVDKEAESLRQSASFKSNDEHVLALARLSGARLLYSRDGPLGDDFKDVRLLGKPRGKVYPEKKGAGCRRWLQSQQNLCAN